jgi:hypothetical protein
MYFAMVVRIPGQTLCISYESSRLSDNIDYGSLLTASIQSIRHWSIAWISPSRRFPHRWDSPCPRRYSLSFSPSCVLRLPSSVFRSQATPSILKLITDNRLYNYKLRNLGIEGFGFFPLPASRFTRPRSSVLSPPPCNLDAIRKNCLHFSR